MPPSSLMSSRSLSGPLFAKLLRMSLPVIGLNLLGVISLAIDTKMCGMLPHSEIALEALGYATQIIFIFVVLNMGLVVGATATLARAHGAGDSARSNHILSQSIAFTGIVALLVTGLGIAIATPTLHALGARGESVAVARSFLIPSLLGTLFPYISMLLASLLRCVGNTRLPFMIGLGSNALNVVLNYALIFGNWGFPELGVMGAAIGTVVSQAVGLAVLLAIMRRGVGGLQLELKFRTIDFDLAKTLMRIGAPAALDMVILNVGFMSILGMLAHLNPTAVAAHGVGMRVQALAFVPGFSIAQTTGALIGNALGKRDRQLARATARMSLAMTIGLMTALAGVLFWFAEPIISWFDLEPGGELFALAVLWVRILAVGMPVVGCNVALIGIFRGSGATTTSLVINVLSTAAQIPLSYWLGYSLALGPVGVWAGFPLSFLLKALLSIYAYRQSAWDVPGAKL